MTRTELLAVAKPILFNTEMTKAIQNGTKTVTRRIALPNKDLREFHSEKYPDGWWIRGRVCKDWDTLLSVVERDECKCRYRKGDILYVRETWCKYDADHVIDGVKYAYKADATPVSEEARKELGYKWKPSIHMPKKAARIFLRVTNVRVERLQDCGNMQAKDEGLNCCAQFIRVWDSTVKKSDLDRYGWDANPWVWVISFERIEVERNG